MSGQKYAAGGIRTTVERTRAASDDDLRANLRRLITEMARQGTTTVECKSGYGLTVDQEERAVRIAAELADEVTYLGAHVVPTGWDAAAYAHLAATDMLAACAPTPAGWTSSARKARSTQTRPAKSCKQA